jgi:hypothetical protein
LLRKLKIYLALCSRLLHKLWSCVDTNGVSPGLKVCRPFRAMALS